MICIILGDRTQLSHKKEASKRALSYKLLDNFVIYESPLVGGIVHTAIIRLFKLSKASYIFYLLNVASTTTCFHICCTRQGMVAPEGYVDDVRTRPNM